MILLPVSDIVGTTVNQHRELLCELLINANMCMLNGRNFKQNDYTSKDAVVVDYVLIPHEQLLLYSEFNIVKVHDLFKQAGRVGMYYPLRFQPDPNMLQCNLSLEMFQFV